MMFVMSGIQKAIDLAGGQSALAQLMTNRRRAAAVNGTGFAEVKQGHVYYWLNTNLPSHVALEIEAALNGQITRQELLPELFGEPQPGQAVA